MTATRWRARIRRNLSLFVGAALVGTFVAGALLADVIALYPPARPDYDAVLQPPSAKHLFGTDQHGRDLFTRVLYGARISLATAGAAVALAGTVGITIGLVVGFAGGWIDEVAGRGVDALFAFPVVLMALLILTVLGPSQGSLILAIAMISVAQFVRVTRSATISERVREYVAASRALGSSTSFIVFRSILPNVLSTVAVLVSIGFAFAILNEAALSFLGLGARPPTPAWGVMLSEGRGYLREAPWYTVAPGMAIFLVVLGLNLLSDGVHNLVDPRRTDARTAGPSSEATLSAAPLQAEPVRLAAKPATHMGLCVRDLTVLYGSGQRSVVGAQNISLDVHPGETLALVGESGCGKSTVSLASAGLIEAPGRIVNGAVFVAGRNLVTAGPADLRAFRGSKVAMVFQDPMSSLNPSMTVGDQITEMLNAHIDVSRQAALSRATELLDEVGIRNPTYVLRLYPHEMSGGMCQRVMIAMAISLNPAVLIADEPTTALDVTVQARILRLLAALQHRHGLAMLLITHDLSIAAAVADAIAVMYGTVIVEYGRARDVINEPLHPYTKGLTASVPRGHWKTHRLASLGGRPPQLRGAPVECPYRERCPDAFRDCSRFPALTQRRTDNGVERAVRCHLYEALNG